MINLKLLIIIFSLIFNYHLVLSQVTVSLRQPPQYQFKVEDFWKVTLNNITQNTYNVFLYGKASNTKDGKIVDANTKIFALKPGITVVTASNVSPINIIEKNKKYEDAISVSGGLPTGDYEICLTVYNADNNEVLGYECIEHNVEIISGIELLLPENKASIIGNKQDLIQGIAKLISYKMKDIGSDLTEKPDKKLVKKKRDMDLYDDVPEYYVNGSFITFSWLAPSPAPRNGRITYTITIAEMLLRQSSYDALQSNPEFFKASGLASTVYQFPFMARGFKEGSKYAWKVTAYLNGSYIAESETNEFTYATGVPDTSVRKKIRGYSLLNDNFIDKLKLQTAGIKTLQKKSNSIFKFSGNGRIYGENSNMQGIGSDKPQRYLNFELTPTLSIYGVPFSLPILLSTQNQDDKQNINSFAFQFDPSVLKDIVQKRVESELEKVKDEIEQKIKDKGEKFRTEIEKQAEDKAMGNIPKLFRIFSYFQNLGIGTTYPTYTQHTLNGVPVTGANIEFNPGLFYIALTGFKNQKPVDNEAYKRSLYSVRLGVGNKDKSHFIMTLMHVFDDENSIKIDSSNLALTPKANWVFGMDGKLNLFKDKLSIEAEGVLSMLTRDVRDPDIISDVIPKWVKNIFKPKGSSSADYMYRFRGSYINEQTNTTISAEMKMIGPGFTTLGNPSLRNDKLGFEGKVDQKLIDRKITLGISFRKYRDNLIDTKTATTSSTSIIFRLGLNFRNLPTLNLMIMPNLQKNDKEFTTTDSSKMDNKTWLYNLVSSYNLKIGDITAQTTALFSYNTNKTLFGIYDYWTKSSSLTETFMFRFPLTISSSIGMVQVLERNSWYTRVITFDLAPSYTIKEILNITGGLNVAVDKDRNKKISISLNSNVTLWNFLNLDMRAERNVYTDWTDRINNYNEFIFRTTLSAGW